MRRRQMRQAGELAAESQTAQNTHPRARVVVDARPAPAVKARQTVGVAEVVQLPPRPPDPSLSLFPPRYVPPEGLIQAGLVAAQTAGATVQQDIEEASVRLRRHRLIAAHPAGRGAHTQPL